ncbi:RT26 protein, partial [Caloenas nicobarica]|nr:RT26 protein [Caloenas nicobarica]
GPGSGPFPGPCPAWGPRLLPARGRKTRHDPPAKSKASRLKVPPPVDPEELLVVLERYRLHRLVLSALRGGLGLCRSGLWVCGAAVKEEAGCGAAMGQGAGYRAVELLWDRAFFFFLCGREERIRKEEEERKRQKLQAAENQARRLEAFLKEKEQEVLQLQEEAKTFITPENLDARIEECLDNPRNYNFAIDKDGRIVKRTVLS